MTCDRSTLASPTRPLVVSAGRAVVTLLLYSYEVDRVRVLTDTRITSKSRATRAAAELRSETLWTPEQTLLIVVTGVVGIARHWHRRLMLEPGLRDAPDLHHVATPRCLAAASEDQVARSSRPGEDTTVYHFVRTPSAGVIDCFRYRAASGFACEPAARREPAVVVVPPPVPELTQTTGALSDLIALARSVHEQQASLPSGIPTGGLLELTTLDDTGCFRRVVADLDA